ncbi:hypothetical protein [Oceanobacillus neutriphilus]|uniref:Uncharacterized protein n=1 Tax=Oceanobacillus neutriphilus TaxID=531815 RepID=A0ABQ2NU81_9BACI|nr:hypothetical protein [Oceanobacillus neutriphilus]GGP10681.1 hypothetical protein GCM10011346_19780 [Oceanobacillus neutriphilus]
MAAAIVSLWAYPKLPVRLESYSDVDWVSQKGVIVVIIPTLMLFIFCMFQLASLVGRKYLDVQRLKSVLNVLLIFIIFLLLALHTFMLLMPLDLDVSLDVTSFVAIVLGIYFIILGNYFPRIQRSKIQKEAPHDKEKPKEVIFQH